MAEGKTVQQEGESAKSYWGRSGVRLAQLGESLEFGERYSRKQETKGHKQRED